MDRREFFAASAAFGLAALHLPDAEAVPAVRTERVPSGWALVK
ncbi:hypothetical protein [Streptomyces sp. NPDC002490]